MVDALSAPSQSGGMRLYVEEVVKSWPRAGCGSDDTLIIHGDAWILDSFRDIPYVILRKRKLPGTLGRLVSQIVGTGILYWLTRADAVLALGPVVSPLVPRKRKVCVVHDWRHKKHPEEFPASVLLFRRLWLPSIENSRAVAAISIKTLRETQQYTSRSDVSLVENGGDHPRRWMPPATPKAEAHSKRIVTFGHHRHKRPDLVIRSMSLLPREQLEEVELIILGAEGDFAHELSELAECLGVGGNMQLPGFVSDADYQSVISGADLVILASTDEGYGLPVAEARYFGAEVIATTDSGLSEIHGPVITLARPNPQSLSQAISVALVKHAPAGERSQLRSWDATARELRSLLTE